MLKEMRKVLKHPEPGTKPKFTVREVIKIVYGHDIDVCQSCKQGALLIIEKWTKDRASPPDIEKGFKQAMKKYPDNFYFLNDFDIPFGQWIYGGADVFLMPSNFEPCGLGQMIAIEYGTIPVVRATGGLADTVKEGQTGFTFKDKNPEQLLRAVKRAVKAYQDQSKWMKMIKNGMTADHSWTNSAREYQKLYYKLTK